MAASPLMLVGKSSAKMITPDISDQRILLPSSSTTVINKHCFIHCHQHIEEFGWLGLERECAEWSDHRPIIARPSPNISLPAVAITSPMITNQCYSASTSMSGGPHLHSCLCDSSKKQTRKRGRSF